MSFLKINQQGHFLHFIKVPVKSDSTINVLHRSIFSVLPGIKVCLHSARVTIDTVLY